VTFAGKIVREATFLFTIDEPNRKRAAMKKLKLNRETISILTTSQLEYAQGAGGGGVGPVQVRTLACPVMTNGCTGGPCAATIGTSGTSVINPSGG
jgi:hypothetical protein